MRASILFAVSLCAAGALAQPVSPALAQAAQQDQAGPPIALTPTLVDAFLGANKDVSALEAKIPNDSAPDAKLMAQLDAAAKKGGFSGYDQYGQTEAAISAVMDGIDPDTKTFVGAQAVLKKQIAQIQADKTLKPADKKQALEQMNDALKSAGSDQPPAGNVSVVTQNYAKLNAVGDQQ